MVVSVAQVSASIRMLWGFSGISKKVVFLKSVFSVVIEVLTLTHFSPVNFVLH